MKETRKLYSEDLRRLCIQKGWYTNGSNEEYQLMLTLADKCVNVKSDDIVGFARDILIHSDTEYPLESICFEVAKICNSFFKQGGEKL